jgi:hypothetical protein
MATFFHGNFHHLQSSTGNILIRQLLVFEVCITAIGRSMVFFFSNHQFALMDLTIDYGMFACQFPRRGNKVQFCQLKYPQ